MSFDSKIMRLSPPALCRRPSSSSTFSSNSSSSSAASSLLSPPPVLMHQGWSPAARAATTTTEDYFSIASALSSPSCSTVHTAASSLASDASALLTPPSATSSNAHDYFSLSGAKGEQQQRPAMPNRRQSSLTPSSTTPSSLTLLSASVAPSTAYPSWPSRDSLSQSQPIIASASSYYYDASNHGSSYISDDDLQAIEFADNPFDALHTVGLADSQSCIGLGITAASGKKSIKMASSFHHHQASPSQAVGFSWTAEKGLEELEKNLEVDERRYVRRAPPPGMAMCAKGAKTVADKKKTSNNKKAKAGSAKSVKSKGAKRGLEVVVEEC